MTPAALRNLRALAEKATPGQRAARKSRVPGYRAILEVGDVKNGPGYSSCVDIPLADAELAAACSRENVLALLDEIERLRAAELICLGCRPHDGLPNVLDLSEVPQ